MDDTTRIILDPIHVGFRVIVGGAWIGSVLTDGGTILATPADSAIPAKRFSTIGTALDYLMESTTQ